MSEIMSISVGEFGQLDQKLSTFIGVIREEKIVGGKKKFFLSLTNNY